MKLLTAISALSLARAQLTQTVSTFLIHLQSASICWLTHFALSVLGEFPLIILRSLSALSTAHRS